MIRKTSHLGVVVNYVRWPETGCGLAEARRRTADCGLTNQIVDLGRKKRHAEIELIDEQMSAGCLDHLKNGRLIAYGRPGSSAADRQLITTPQWKALISIEWENSSASDDRLRIFDICVYPPLLAPSRNDLLPEWTLAEAFKELVLGDAEVARLGREALRLSPEFEAVFVRGRCHVHGSQEWPLGFDRWSMITMVDPDPDIRSKFSPGEPDPIEVVIAAQALIHRYSTLILMLRRGEIEGWGVPAKHGRTELIPRSIWSHEEFHFDSSTGDILQDNPESTGHYDSLTRRWIGVVLQKTEPSPHRFSQMFHGKPPAHDGLPPATPEPQQTPAPRSKAMDRVETKVTSLRACQAWLVEIIASSPDQRIFTRENLWGQAKQKWSTTLSYRQFLVAREAAIRQTGAVAWGASGAPRKSQHRKSPR